jgi:carbon-monoxide dehydrogenase medium subunit
MPFRPEKYLFAGSPQEAARILDAEGERAVVVGGGTALRGFASRGLLNHVEVLVDLQRAGLRFVREEEGWVTVGAATRLWELERELEETGRHANLQNSPAYRMLLEAVRCLPVQVRSLATVGGSLCSAHPSFDPPAALIALEAQVEIIGPSGSRSLPLHGFFRDFLVTELGRGELVTQVRIPKPPPGTVSTFLRLARNAGDISLVNVAVRLTLASSSGSRCRGVRIVLGGVGPTVVRALETETALEGRALEREAIEGALRAMERDIQPWDDLRASASYRREIVKVLLKRALLTLAAQRR